MTISENAKKTAQWWTSQLRGSSVKMDNGVPEHAAIHTAVAAMFQPREDRYSEDQLKRFEDALISRIEASIAERQESLISVDYDPDKTLCEAAELAGIPLSMMDLP